MQPDDKGKCAKEKLATESAAREQRKVLQNRLTAQSPESAFQKVQKKQQAHCGLLFHVSPTL
ncbi:hypothetical protein AZ46_0217120 [Metabacillus indicus LMG 22858]|nr:hypothetical protein AZ46_0217120 [Metabacillus indicus LMG 22858]